MSDSEYPILWPATFDDRTDGCDVCSSISSNGLMAIAAPRSFTMVYIYISDRASQATRTGLASGGVRDGTEIYIHERPQAA